MGSAGARKGKGKEPEKLVAVSLCGGKKHKRLKKVAAKDVNDNKIEEVTGPLKGKGKERARSGSESRNMEWIIEGLDWLVVAVERLTEGVRVMTVAHKSVAQSVYHAGVIMEQILHKYKLFLTLVSRLCLLRSY